MATSGSDNFTVNRDQIIKLAGLGAGILGIGRVASADHTETASRLLNLFVKQLMGRTDLTPGVKSWTRKRAFLFPESGENEFLLGSSGDHATASYNTSTLSGAEAAGQTVLSITATTGMVNGDYIGIRLDSGVIHWTTIVSFVASTSVTITTQLPTAAASGSTVYWYTTKISVPLSIISIRRLDTNSNETPLSPMKLMDYEEIGNKTNDGDPSRFLYERGITNGKLFFDLEMNDTTDIYLLTYLRPIEDFDAATDTPDYPQEYERLLVGQLMMDWATFSGRPVTQEMKLYRDEALMIAGNLGADENTSEVFFQAET